MKSVVVILMLVIMSIPVFASDHALNLGSRTFTSENSITNIENIEEDYYIIDVGEYPINQEIINKISKFTTLESYIPYSFYVIKVNKHQIKKLKELNTIKRIWKYTSEFNYDTALKDSQTNGDIKIAVYLFNSANQNYIINKLNKIGAIIYSDKLNIWMITSQINIQEISNTKGVAFISKFEDAELLNDLTNVVTGSLDFRNIWNLFGNDQIIAIGDTGLDTGINDSSMHDDFEGRIHAIINLANLTLGGPCPTFCSTTSADIRGHGTHVSGSALGDGNKSGSTPSLNIYTNSYAGAAPNSKIVVVDIGGDNSSSNSVFPSPINSYLSTGYDNNAKIMSGSWGFLTSFGAYTGATYIFDLYSYTHPDLVVTQAAGNSGPNPSTVANPSTAKNAISVGANNKSNVNQIAAFSGRGPTLDGRIKPDIITPGILTISTKSQMPSALSCQSGGPNQFYAQCSGTSMATPVIAGLSALAREYFQKVRNVQNPSASLIKASLINGAEDMGYGIPSFTTGWGRANISNSFPPYGITTPNPNIPVEHVFFLDNPMQLTAASQSYLFNVYPYPNTRLKATLVWNDKEPSSAILANQSLPKLVNDLDFKLTDPSGTVYSGNDFTAPFNDQFDRLNNIEQIRIPNTLSGHYNFTVTAFNIPLALLAPQNFSVVINYEIPPPSITISGIPSIGNTLAIQLSDSNFKGEDYLLLMSLTTSTGIPIGDGRIFPLDGDFLFFITLFIPQAIGLFNSQGILDSDGNATATFTIPSYAIPGLTISVAYVILEPSLPLPYSIQAISPPSSFTIS